MNCLEILEGLTATKRCFAVS
uniref:Uncharacterized protein n=1 Tax=Arundo donax TaxID=35708 RepID=A0A0A9AUI5_ARUDO